MSTFRWRAVASAWALLALSTLATAQSGVGTVTGMVTDSTGAFIPGAEVRLTNTATNQSAVTRSNESGVYVFSSVLPGSYVLSARSNGFKEQNVRNIRVETAQELRLDLRLEPGSLQQSIDVTANSTPINQETTELGTTITAAAVSNLPLNTRNPYALLELAPGVTAGRGDPSAPAYDSDASVNGSRTRNNTFSVDGASTDAVVGLEERAASIEAIHDQHTVGGIRAVVRRGDSVQRQAGHEPTTRQRL